MADYRFGKIVILQTAFAGDVILSTPLAEALKGLFPEADIHYVVTPETADLLRNHPCIARIWRFDKRGSDRGISGLVRTMRRLRKEGFDLAVIPHRSLRSAVLMRGASVPRRAGFSRSAGLHLLTDVVPYERDLHEVERNLRLIEPFGFKGPVPEPRLYPGEKEKSRIEGWLHERGIARKPLMVMAPGSIWPTKRWPRERFAGAADGVWKRWKIPVVMIGGRGDIPVGEAITAGCGEGVFNAVGQFSFLESAELVGRSRVILTNDSAPLHLATAMGTPVVAIFGPTVTGFGFGPRGGADTVLEVGLSCRPCGEHGGRSCPKGHFRCMLDCPVERVLEALSLYLSDR